MIKYETEYRIHPYGGYACVARQIVDDDMIVYWDGDMSVSEWESMTKEEKDRSWAELHEEVDQTYKLEDLKI